MRLQPGAAGALAHNDQMKSTHDLQQTALPSAWTELLANRDPAAAMTPQAYRLAFADPEFLLRRETRGVRMPLEMLKPDLAQQEAGIEHTVVVFGSARFQSLQDAQAALQQAQAAGDAQGLRLAQRAVRNAAWYEQAREFARLVSEQCACIPEQERLYICTGGGPGIMEAANRGAHEAGVPSVALNIALPHEQSANPYVTPALSFKFHYFALRKMHFMMRAKALVAFPGGFGTLDELFEVLTLVQTRKAHPVPILLYGSAFWQRLFNLDALVDEGTIAEEDLALFQYVDSPRQAWQAICDFYKLQVAAAK